MMKTGKMIAGVFAAAFLLSGCMTEEHIQKQASDPRIDLVENSSKKVRLLSSSSFIDDNGFLTVNAQVLLSRTEPLRWIFCGDPKVPVYFRLDFLNGKGEVCASRVSEIMAASGNIVDFQGVAASEKYISYKLTVSLEKLEPSPVKKAAPAKKAAVKKAAPAKKAAVKKAAPAKKAAVKKAAPAKKAAVKKAVPAKKAAVKKAAPAKKAADGKLTEPFN